MSVSFRFPDVHVNHCMQQRCVLTSAASGAGGL
jgi:hypothetical protein